MWGRMASCAGLATPLAGSKTKGSGLQFCPISGRIPLPSSGIACGFASTAPRYLPPRTRRSTRPRPRFRGSACTVVGVVPLLRRSEYISAPEKGCSERQAQLGRAPAHSSATLMGEYRTTASELLKSIHLETMPSFLPRETSIRMSESTRTVIPISGRSRRSPRRRLRTYSTALLSVPERSFRIPTISASPSSARPACRSNARERPPARGQTQ